MAKRDTIGTKLTAAKVKSLLAKREAGRYGDGRGGYGLMLIVSPKGAGRWIQRVSCNGKVKDFSLGSCQQIGLAAARQKAADNHQAIQSGGSPGESGKAPTFAEALNAVIAGKRWRNGKSEAQWRSSLAAYASPLMDRPIDQIKAKEMTACLDRIWQAKPETARRVLQRLSAIMDWAVANEHREYNPVIAIARAMPKQEKGRQHFRALPHAEVADAIARVRASKAFPATKLAFEFLVLTAARSGEVRGAVWGEIDLDNAVWKLPASRMKAKQEHRVPLSPRALKVLGAARRLYGGEGLVFPSPKRGKQICDMTLSKLIRELGINAVPHGFRSSFRNWAGELSGASHEACERALAHTVRNQAEAAYNTTDLLDKRRGLMNDWAAYLAR